MRSATREGEHSAKEYVAVTSDWFNSIARPNMLYDASVFLDLYRYGFTPGAQKGFQKQVLAYRDGFSTYFRSRGEVDMLLDTELLMLAEDPAGAKECAVRGLASFQNADEVIAAGQHLHSYDELKTFLPRFRHAVRESIQYGTLVSYWTLVAVEKAGHSVENPGRFTEIFEAFEPLRADSRNLLFREHLYPKVWGIIADRFGIADSDLLAGLTFAELDVMASTDEIPATETLARRKAGCVVWYEEGDDALSFDFEPDTFAQVMALETKDFDGKELRGRVAQKGKVRGTVRIIFSLADAKSFQDGDVIVSSSTNPSLMPYLIRCGAIVTDEGGIASHAAIVAREMKKPCIIGTKIATQVLKDGDLVEVDAESGIVTILERR